MKKTTTRKSSTITNKNLWEMSLNETTSAERSIMKTSLENTYKTITDTTSAISKEKMGLAWDAKQKLKKILKYESDLRMGK